MILICTRLERDANTFTDGQTVEYMAARLRTMGSEAWSTEIRIEDRHSNAFPDLAVGKVYDLSLTLHDDQAPANRREQESWR